MNFAEPLAAPAAARLKLCTGQFYGSAGAPPKLPVKANQLALTSAKFGLLAKPSILPVETPQN